jgi:hypothetical protein
MSKKLGEIFFWGGTVLVGKDIVKKYMECINPIKWINNKWYKAIWTIFIHIAYFYIKSSIF